MPDELGRPCMQHDPMPCGPHYSPVFQPDTRDEAPMPADPTPPPVPAAPESVYVAAATASVRTEGVNDGYIQDTARERPFRAAVDVAYELGVAAGRTAAAAALEAERVKRAATACCNGTGYCGIDDCRVDAAWDDALSDAARIAEGNRTDG